MPPTACRPEREAPDSGSSYRSPEDREKPEAAPRGQHQDVQNPTPGGLGAARIVRNGLGHTVVWVQAYSAILERETPPHSLRDIILAVEACPNGHRSIESNLISGVPARGLGR